MKVKQSRYSWAVFGYLPAIESGLRDSIRPGGLTALIIFFIFMYFALSKWKHPLLGGTGFILGLFAGKFYVLNGVLDVFFRNRYYWLVMEIMYILWTLVVIFIGGVLFRDWWMSRIREKKDMFLIHSPFTDASVRGAYTSQAKLLSGINIRLFIKNIFFMFVFIGCGLGAALAVAAFPEDTNILYVIYEEGMTGGALLSPHLSAIYAITFCILISMSFFVFTLIMTCKEAVQYLKMDFTFLQIFFSGIFLAYGVGMGVILIFK